jgi:two-component system nitrate/nitrite response regulator NarL
VLIDADLAARATAADVADIRRVSGGAVVIAFVPTQCHARVAVAFRNGMDGCIAADAGIEIVLSTVRHAMLGERVFPGRFFEKLLEESEATGTRNTATESGEQRHAATVVHPSAGRRIDDLTPREREALQQLTFGHTNKEVARRMGLAEATVKVYIRSLCRKLKVKNRTQAVATLSLDPGLAGRRSGG